VDTEVLSYTQADRLRAHQPRTLPYASSLTTMPQVPTFRICLPQDLLQDAPTLAELAGTQAPLEFDVPDGYDASPDLGGIPSEVFLIQRILTLARAGVAMRVIWGSAIAARVATAAPLYPLLAVLVTLQCAKHEVRGQSPSEGDDFAAKARTAIAKYRLTGDLFSTSQVLICADSRGQSRPPDLYNRSNGKLRSREDFETMVVELLTTQVNQAVEQANAFRQAAALGVVVAELVENTDMHARFDLSGSPVGPDAIRGIYFKRVALKRPPPTGSVKGSLPVDVDFLEVSVFDTGLGYFCSYAKKPLESSTDLELEWKVLHNCFERHYFSGTEDQRPGHRAMGLAEVLRAIQALKGRIDVRTGRLFAYRTFMTGDLQAQMEEYSSRWARLAWPRPKLLDVEKKYVAVPSLHEGVVGAAIRIVVPLT